MLPLIAWRNIWRSAVRSLVTVTAVAVGIWALIVLLALSQGMIRSYVSRSIENRTSHIQIHHPKWVQDKELAYSLDREEIARVLDEEASVAVYSERVVISGMIQSARSSYGIKFVGIDPEEENSVTNTREKIIEGDMLTPGERNQIVIGKAMAERLQLSLRNKVIISFQDVDGNISTAALKIIGIYSINDNQFEQQIAYMLRSQLQELAGLEDGQVQEVALLLNDFDQLKEERDALQALLPNAEVRDYGEIAPEVELYNSSLNLTIGIMTAIVMLALIFGIINTMLMAILERERELGMLRAIGMGKPKVFGMVVLETILLSLVGLPAGLLLGRISIGVININGLDLSNWAAGLSEFGMSNVIYPELAPDTYLFIGFAIFFTAVLASLYPAYKAISLKPLDAIHRL